MRYPTLGALVWCVIAAAAGHAAPDAQLMAPIQKFVDSFNKGDMAAAAATHAAGPDLAIIDEVSPHLWQGPLAFKAWSADLDSDAKKRGITDPVMTISAPTREETSGDHAYVVVPGVYTFKEHGAAMREEGQFVFALQKAAGGWLIHGWAWTGPKPEPAAAAAQR
jgi:hypothetical protein